MQDEALTVSREERDGGMEARESRGGGICEREGEVATIGLDGKLLVKSGVERTKGREEVGRAAGSEGGSVIGSSVSFVFYIRPPY